MITLNTDGGSRGNPGPSGCAYVLRDGDMILETGKYFLGDMTNNQAEYLGALAGLEAAQRRGITSIELIMDSELVIRQLRGEYRVKDPTLRTLYERIRSITQSFTTLRYISVLRSRNALADSLANEAMDAREPLWKDDLGGSQISFF